MRVARKTTIPTLLEALSRQRITVPAAPLRAGGWGLVTSLPPSPAVGDACQYVADKTNGIIWELVYSGEGTYPWLVLGSPPPLFAEVATDQGCSITAYGDLATIGPSVVPPLKGVYDLEVGAEIFGASPGNARMSFAVGAAAALDADSLRMNNGGSTVLSGTRPRRITLLAAATALVAKYRREAAGETFFGRRWMQVRPVRVG